MSKLELIDESPLIEEHGRTSKTNYYKAPDGRKFKIHYDNSNGWPMGFNYKFSASKFNGDKWNYIEEIKDLDMSKGIPNYFSKDKSIEHMNEFFDKMETRIENVYL